VMHEALIPAPTITAGRSEQPGATRGGRVRCR
jgi:hypothetical protein